MYLLFQVLFYTLALEDSATIAGTPLGPVSIWAALTGLSSIAPAISLGADFKIGISKKELGAFTNFHYREAYFV